METHRPLRTVLALADLPHSTAYAMELSRHIEDRKICDAVIVEVVRRDSSEPDIADLLKEISEHIRIATQTRVYQLNTAKNNLIAEIPELRKQQEINRKYYSRPRDAPDIIRTHYLR